MSLALVTGAGGFVGQVTCAHLRASGFGVRALLRTRRALGPWDEAVLADLAAPLPAGVFDGVDHVFHLAGKAHALDEIEQDEAEYRAVAVDGTRRLLAAMSQHAANRIVFVSSVKAMGEETDTCLAEDAEPRPATAYGRTKLEAERLVLSWGQQPGRHACCLRLPMVYGVGSKGNLVRMIAAIDRGVFPPLPEVGNHRSLVHVGNVAEAALLAAERPAAAGQIYIVADARPWSTRQLYEAICRALGRSVPRFTVPLWALRALARTGDHIGRLRGRRFAFDSGALAKLLGSAWYSPGKIGRELDYQPSTSLEAELPAIVGWYRGGGVPAPPA